MYAEDSFFTLTVPGQIGLALISTVLALSILWLTCRMCRTRPLYMRLAIAAIMFFAFVWLAPQVYYTYYIFLLEGLPWQFVINNIPTPLDLINLLLFQDRQNLSFHSQGVLGWLLFLVGYFSKR